MIAAPSPELNFAPAVSLATSSSRPQRDALFVPEPPCVVAFLDLARHDDVSSLIFHF